MLPGFLLALREGLEVALIVGLLLASLKKLGYADRVRTVWLGAGSAALLSLVVAVGLTVAGAELEGLSEALYEGVTLLLAAVVLTWMIFWMQRRGRSTSRELEAQVSRAIADERGHGLFLVAFVAVLREGVELALFMTAAAVASSTQLTWVGGLLGGALAATVGYALFASTTRLDVRRFFQMTGIILLIFAAGLVARGIHEFVEIGWLPALMDNVWNTASMLSDQSVLGQVAGSLLGYRSSPSLAEVISYIGYLAMVLFWLGWTSRARLRAPQRA
jgi:high-affinity iron transporter